MHVGFQFESFPTLYETQRRYQARSVSIRAGTPRGLQSRRPLESRRRRRREYIMTMARLTIYVMLLGVQVVNSCSWLVLMPFPLALLLARSLASSRWWIHRLAKM